MVQMTMLEAANAMGGEIVRGSATSCFAGIVLDSRTLQEPETGEFGPLFFALEGAATDGHRFVSGALKDGAAGAVVREAPVASNDSASDGPASNGSGTLIQVEDTYLAMHALVRHVRLTTPKHLVAITGSAGKTTTKELLTAMLSERFDAAPSPGNYNNLYGFPIALMSIANGTEWMVAEMGMSTPGELAGVSLLGRPEIGIFTNVCHAHVEGFERAGLAGRSGEELITDAKAELLEGLDPDGLVIVNAADRNTLEIARRHLARGNGTAIGFARSVAPRKEASLAEPVAADCDDGSNGDGFSTENLAIPLEVEELATTSEGHRLLLRVRSTREEQELFLPLHGAVNIENFLAAATCAHHLGVDLASIARSMSSAALPAGRGAVLDIGGALVIDDSYNSNPAALEKALRAAAVLHQKGDSASSRRDREGGQLWAVLGEMKELGSASAELHREAGELAGALGFNKIVGVGEIARELLAGASDAGARVNWFTDASAATEVAENLRPGDVVLVKGSRSVGLERVVEAFAQADTNGQPFRAGGPADADADVDVDAGAEGVSRNPAGGNG